MKTMTCQALGGPCDLEHRGESADDVIKAQDRHLKEAEKAGGEAALANMVPYITSKLTTFISNDMMRPIIAQQKKCRTNTVQLCDRIERKVYQQLRVSMPGIALVQVIHVIGREAIDEAIAVAPFVNAVLLDSGNPKASIKELGGTGRVHDWSISKAIREILSIPVFLAGGLRPDNVGRAVADVGPFCFDVCSGVRTDGRLDKDKLSRFFKEIREKEIVMP